MSDPHDARAAEEAAPYRGFPGARRPDRRRELDVGGLRLAVWEWGPEDGAPILLAHGGFDFAGTYDVLAPLLADAGHRVVSWDQRGHGDSEHAALYSWVADLRDAWHVLQSIPRVPVVAIGHSKGGSILNQLTEACPHRFSHLVNIDGLPSQQPHPDVADHERTRLLAEELSGWLDHRLRAGDRARKPGTLDELARRRARMNPRLSLEWLRYLATVGARRDEDGWRWKLDPQLRFGGFGPWRRDWALERLPGQPVPLLGIIGTEDEPMAWGATREALEPHLPPGGRLEVVQGTGHFVHIEKPAEVARLVLDFLP